MIRFLVLLVCSVLPVMTFAQTSMHVSATPIAAELGVKWNMTPAEASLVMVGSRIDSIQNEMRFLFPAKRSSVHHIDSVRLYCDAKGISFMRVDFRNDNHKTIIEYFTAKYGLPSETGPVVTRWIDAEGRWINLFPARGKKGAATNHVVANISRDPAIIGNQAG